MCNEIYMVPLLEPGSDETDTSSWRMRTPEGQTFGPVSRAELDEWVSEGRVSAECLLSSDIAPEWVHADAVFSGLASPAPQATTAHVRQTRYIAPSRGGLILALAIMSWALICPVFGICAWVMGSSDLREMREGRMDASGAGLTQAGQVIGMIHALIGIIVIVVIVFLLLLGFGWR